MRRYLHQSLSSASEQIATTSNKEVMGKGEGVVLEADVGYKDGKSVFSPHGASQSHVEEDAQVDLPSKGYPFVDMNLVGRAKTLCNSMTAMYAEQEKASKKIAELESMQAIIDQERTPTGQGTQGSSRLSSVKDELKAQLSSIKAGLAESFESERGAEDIGSKVRSQMQSLHESISKVSHDLILLVACVLPKVLSILLVRVSGIFSAS